MPHARRRPGAADRRALAGGRASATTSLEARRRAGARPHPGRAERPRLRGRHGVREAPAGRRRPGGARADHGDAPARDRAAGPRRAVRDRRAAGNYRRHLASRGRVLSIVSGQLEGGHRGSGGRGCESRRRRRASADREGARAGRGGPRRRRARASRTRRSSPRRRRTSSRALGPARRSSLNASPSSGRRSADGCPRVRPSHPTGGRPASSTRSTREASRTRTATASATLPGSRTTSTTSAAARTRSPIDAIWLSPIYPSPDFDFGYDVADYVGVDPKYGTLADFERLVEAAHRARDADRPGPRPEPHQPRARLVRGVAREPRQPVRGLVHLARLARALAPRRPPDARTTGGRSSAARPGSGTRAAASSTCTRSCPQQPDLNWRNPAVRAAHHGRRPDVARPRRRRLPARRLQHLLQGRGAALESAADRAAGRMVVAAAHSMTATSRSSRTRSRSSGPSSTRSRAG